MQCGRHTIRYFPFLGCLPGECLEGLHVALLRVQAGVSVSTGLISARLYEGVVICIRAAAQPPALFRICLTFTRFKLVGSDYRLSWLHSHAPGLTAGLYVRRPAVLIPGRADMANSE